VNEQNTPEKAPVFDTAREIGDGAVGRVEPRDAARTVRRLARRRASRGQWLHPNLKDDANAAARSSARPNSARSCAIPSLVRHLFAGERDGLPYLVTEYVPGRSLRQALDEDGEARAAGAQRRGGTGRGARGDPRRGFRARRRQARERAPRRAAGWC
jgi:hypothetical protein